MARLDLLRGPAGAGKSQAARRKLDAGEADVLADTTAIYAAVSGAERGPDGRYPVRDAGDPLLPMATYLRAVVAREGLRRGFNVLVTSSRRDDLERWRDVASEFGAEFAETIIDPGRDVVAARLADPETGQLSGECSAALARWYDDE